MQLLRKIILASSSEQRKLLLNQIGLQNFEITPSEINENCLDVNLPITKKVVELAYLKAIAVKKRQPTTDCIIISGDTEVFLGAVKFLVNVLLSPRSLNIYQNCQVKSILYIVEFV